MKKTVNSKQFLMGLLRPARFFWLIMLVGHTPALVNYIRYWMDGQTPSGFYLKFAVLLLSFVYFTFKLAGYRFIQQTLNHHQLIAYVLIIAFLHAGCVVQPLVPNHSIPHQLFSLFVPFILSVNILVVLKILLGQISRWLGLILLSGERRYFIEWILPVPTMVLVNTSITHRGPPIYFLP